MELDNTDIIIEKYIQGKLSGAALKAFETQMEKDEALQKQVNFYQYTDIFLQDNLTSPKETTNIDTAFKANLDKLGNQYFSEEIENDLYPETAHEEAAAKPSIIKRLLPFATLAAAAALLLFLFLPDKNDRLFDNYFEAEKVLNTHDEIGSLTDFEKAINQYKGKNYQKAIPLFEKSLSEKPDNPWGLVFKGCAQMELNQIDEAMNTFQQLYTKHNDYTDMASWYLALCHLKKGEHTQTKNLLKSISPNETYFEKARQLLKAL